MIYGRSYEGHTRECEACGHYTNVHLDCANCETTICEACEFDGHCVSCRSLVCGHADVSYACADDCDPEAGYYGVRETWTCRDCGEQWDGDEFPPPPARRKPAIAATINTERKAA